ALEVINDDKLPERSQKIEDYLKKELQAIDNPIIKEVRGKVLFIGMELTEKARPYCEKLMEKGLLCKETHDNVIRFAPPLIIEKSDLDSATEQFKADMSK